MEMFPNCTTEFVYNTIATLCYTQHGGSGFTFTRQDVLRMGFDEAEHHIRWLEERRQDEYNKLKNA